MFLLIEYERETYGLSPERERELCGDGDALNCFNNDYKNKPD